MAGELSQKYGILIKERGAVFIVDRDGRLVYGNYLPTLGDEPDYEEVINAAKQALA